MLETNLSAAIEKNILEKKKTCKFFFLLNPTKPEPYDHGMKENNEAWMKQKKKEMPLLEQI